MRKELDEALVMDFPELYADRHADMQTTAMCWGFSCGDGYEPIIRKLSEQLTFLSKVEGVPVKASQVKEKFGSLCFYVDGGTEIMRACISAAENMSTQTCEVCGEYGRLYQGGWWRTLCAKHAHEDGRAIYDWQAKALGITDYIKITNED